jgi:hypothetical protein
MQAARARRAGASQRINIKERMKITLNAHEIAEAIARYVKEETAQDADSTSLQVQLNGKFDSATSKYAPTATIDTIETPDAMLAARREQAT